MSSKEKKDKEEKTIELVLGTQYGSDANDLMDGMVDVRRFSRISQIEALVYPYLLEVPRYRGGRVAKNIVYNKLNLNMSIEGWRANQGIRLIAGSKGAPTIDVLKRPGWIGRNISNRKWQKKAELEGKEIIE